GGAGARQRLWSDGRRLSAPLFRPRPAPGRRRDRPPPPAAQLSAAAQYLTCRVSSGQNLTVGTPSERSVQGANRSFADARGNGEVAPKADMILGINCAAAPTRSARQALWRAGRERRITEFRVRGAWD